MRALGVRPAPDRVWILATGKAAAPMVRGALAWLDRAGVRPLGGLVVAPRLSAHPSLPLPLLAGDHPLPDAASVRAAEAIAGLIPQVRPGDEVWTLLSGGTSSLVGAPVAGMSLRALREVFRAISQAGLEIGEANSIRRRFLLWGGGRLGAALAHARVSALLVSDVPGDDPAVIGSGPLLPDPLEASELKSRLASRDLLRFLPPEAAQLLDRMAAGLEPETPKPGPTPPPPHQIILRNADALAAAADEARRWNYFADIVGGLEGEARTIGTLIGKRLRDAPPGSCLLWGGEPTVTLGSSTGHGGRSQELALSAARELAGSRACLIAAGTDGRDGSTDAAGAIVDGATAEKLRAVGRDLESALERHDTYPALNAAGALFRPGFTGTNVMDLVVGIRPR